MLVFADFLAIQRIYGAIIVCMDKDMFMNGAPLESSQHVEAWVAHNIDKGSTCVTSNVFPKNEASNNLYCWKVYFWHVGILASTRLRPTLNYMTKVVGLSPKLNCHKSL